MFIQAQTAQSYRPVACAHTENIAALGSLQQGKMRYPSRLVNHCSVAADIVTVLAYVGRGPSTRQLVFSCTQACIPAARPSCDLNQYDLVLWCWPDRHQLGKNGCMKLSDDALWLWLELEEQGLQALEDEDLCKYLGADEEPWPSPRLQSAVAELEAAQILSRTAQTLTSAPVQQGMATVKNGALVQVTIKVFSSTEVRIPGNRTESYLVDTVASSLIDSGRPLPAKAEWALYWCSTPDGDEDWFVVAPSAWSACLFHEDAEGYDRGDASAEWVIDIPDELIADSAAECDWPSDELLRACGAEFLPFHPDMTPDKVELRRRMGVEPTAVRINRRIFLNGDIVENTYQRARKPGSKTDN